MKKLSVLLLGLIGLAGCGNDVIKERLIETKTVTVSPTTDTSITNLIAEENEYRAKLAQAPLTQGLACTLYTVTGGDRIQASISGHNTLIGITSVATFLLQASFNQPDAPVSDGLNVLPTTLKNLYKNMYLLRCTGYIVVTTSDYYQFDLTSDDASVLYIDGAKLIDLDNSHAPTLGSATKNLKKGIHALKLDYAQTGSGQEALILNVNGSLLPSSVMYH